MQLIDIFGQSSANRSLKFKLRQKEFIARRHQVYSYPEATYLLRHISHEWKLHHQIVARFQSR